MEAAAAFAANQVTQLAEAGMAFSPAAYAFRSARTSAESAILPLLESLPDLGTYNAQGSTPPSSTAGTQLNLRG